MSQIYYINIFAHDLECLFKEKFRKQENTIKQRNRERVRASIFKVVFVVVVVVFYAIIKISQLNNIRKCKFIFEFIGHNQK